MKFAASSVLASVALAASLVAVSSADSSSSISSPDVAVPAPAPVLEERTGWLGDFIGDLLNPQQGQNCQNGLFYWGGLGGKCVKPSSSTAQPPTQTRSCPLDWSWSSETNCCKPNSKNAASNNWPTCQNGGHSWLGNLLFCGADNFHASSSSACDSQYQFWWNLGGLCCKNGGSGGDAPPSDKGCPDNWYYSQKFGFCLPKSSGSSPTCSKGSWDPATKCCKLDKRDQNGCSTGTQFWWPLGKFCIDNDHDTSGQCPDPSKSCPSTYSWSYSLGHCIPKNVNACTNIGQCTNWKHTWFPSLKWCAGSGPSPHKRSARRTSSLPFGVVDPARCPEGGIACPIGRARSANAPFECLKPEEDIESCGGCSSLGQGQDCTAIAGSRAVGCTAGLCEVYTCVRGFAVGPDGKSCVPSSTTGSTAFLTAQARHAKRAALA